jgi:hypothetical protein
MIEVENGATNRWFLPPVSSQCEFLAANKRRMAARVSTGKIGFLSDLSQPNETRN